MLDLKNMDTQTPDKVDKVVMDVPLFIRMLEFAKEDAKTDMDLHSATEKILTTLKKKGELTMDDYNTIVGKKEEPTEQSSDASGSFEAPMGMPVMKRPIYEQGVMDSGQYDVPFPRQGRKDPLSIEGVDSIKNARAVKDKSFPKWGGPGGVFIKIKDKCKKFPYCNQGDINAIEILRESIDDVAEKYGIPTAEVEKIVLKEIKDIFI